MFSEIEEKMENDHKKARDQELKELAERVSIMIEKWDYINLVISSCITILRYLHS